MNSSCDCISYISSDIAIKIDEKLMSSSIGYSIDQLMETAGLSVALAIQTSQFSDSKTKILTIVGPGNNGGDGLVASRYLKEFGYDVDIYQPKEPKNDLYKRLVKQCNSYGIPFISNTVFDELINKGYNLIIDSIFGFSFKGSIRGPYDAIIKTISESHIPICSIDIPSGWDVDKGNINNTFIPDMLISLTLPKTCSKDYKGEHYLGGRFVPKQLYEKFNIKMPLYKEANMILKL